jgi:hypothetical protein
VEAEDRIRADAAEAAVTDPSPVAPAEPRPEAVPADDREARQRERCVHHPGRAAVARCDVCAEPICVTCAVPVRGRTIGPECVATELGDPALTAPPEPDRGRVGAWIAVAGALLAVAATIGPWTRTGAGDRVLGAWVPDLRWSIVAGVAALACVPAAWWLRANASRRVRLVVAALGAVIVVASLLAIVFPPTFQAASWGPWTALIGGTLVVAGVVVDLVGERRSGQGV